MKYFFISLLFISSFAFAEDFVLSVPKMTCPSCASSIENEVNKLEGIDNLKIDIGNKTVKFSASETNRSSKQQVIDAIKRAGFIAK